LDKDRGRGGGGPMRMDPRPSEIQIPPSLIDDEKKCKHFFNKIFLSGYMPPFSKSPWPYTLPTPAKFLADMYTLWSKHLQFMIYNTPEFTGGGERSCDTDAFYKTFKTNELRRRANLYQRCDTLTHRPFDFLVPLPSLIQTGVVFLQFKKSPEMAASQIFKLGQNGQTIWVNQHKETIINFLPELGC
jgi:hypothetical protein